MCLDTVQTASVSAPALCCFIQCPLDIVLSHSLDTLPLKTLSQGYSGSYQADVK